MVEAKVVVSSAEGCAQNRPRGVSPRCAGGAAVTVPVRLRPRNSTPSAQLSAGCSGSWRLFSVSWTACALYRIPFGIRKRSPGARTRHGSIRPLQQSRSRPGRLDDSDRMRKYGHRSPGVSLPATPTLVEVAPREGAGWWAGRPPTGTCPDVARRLVAACSARWFATVMATPRSHVTGRNGNHSSPFDVLPDLCSCEVVAS